jgi:outer membrane protein OmpA-like peptidoglycan-associated protein
MRGRTCASCFALLLVGCFLGGCASHRTVQLDIQRETVVVPPVIQNVVTAPAGQIDTRTEGRKVTVTMRSDPGLTATFDVEPGATGRAMREVQPGVYEGVYDIPEGFTGDLKFVGRVRHEPTGAQQTMAAPAALKVAKSLPPQPKEEAPPPVCNERAFAADLAAATIYFDFDKWTVKRGERQKLDQLPAIFAQHPLCKTVYVVGHTDNVGAERYNEKLSIRRAEAVAALLPAPGGATPSFEKIGLGFQQPASTARDAASRAKNRRVEFRAVRP